MTGAKQRRSLEEAIVDTVREPLVVLDLEAFYRGVMRDDSGKKLSQRRDVPLAIAQFVKQTAFGFRRRDREGAIKGPAGDDDA